MSEPEASETSAVRTPLTELLGIRYPVVQAAMGYVSGPRLAAAVSDAGGLGLIASATMSLAELEKAIEDPAGRTAGPFGVNLRADAPDAAERVRLIIARRVPVASFAQAPKPELIAALKDAGVVTIASIGAWRHAEKAAGWGVDAVIATGAEGGGHVGAAPTSLLVPQVTAAVDIPVVAAGGLSWGQVLMAANTPVLLRAAMVDGRTDLGLMSSGQVAGLIDDLPSCAELIGSIMAEAGATLDRLGGVRKQPHLAVCSRGAASRSRMGLPVTAAPSATYFRSAWLILVRSRPQPAMARGGNGLRSHLPLWHRTIRHECRDHVAGTA